MQLGKRAQVIVRTQLLAGLIGFGLVSPALSADFQAAHQAFVIPTEALLGSRTPAGATALRLFVSDDEGRTWQKGQTYSAEQNDLEVLVRDDGHYRIAAQVFSASGELLLTAREQVDVLVDSTPPVVDVDLAWVDSQTVLVEAEIDDLSVEMETVSLTWMSADPAASRVDVELSPGDFRIVQGKLTLHRKLIVPELFDVSVRVSAFDSVQQKGVGTEILKRSTGRSALLSHAYRADGISSGQFANSYATPLTDRVQTGVRQTSAQFDSGWNSLPAPARQDAKRTNSSVQESWPETALDLTELQDTTTPMLVDPAANNRLTIANDHTEPKLFELLLALRPTDLRLRASYAESLLENAEWAKAQLELRQLAAEAEYSQFARALLARIPGSSQDADAESPSFDMTADEVWSTGAPR